MNAHCPMEVGPTLDLFIFIGGFTMSERIPDDVVFSRRIIMGMAILVIVLLGSLAYGALRTYSMPQ